VRRLDADPARLAAFWGLPASGVRTIGEIRNAAHALRSVAIVPPVARSEDPAVDLAPCPACGEPVRSDLARRWFCGRALAAAADD
jgi:hypothetical protein